MTAIESGSLKPTRALQHKAQKRCCSTRHIDRAVLLLTGEVVKVWLLVELIKDGAGPELDVVRGEDCYSILGQFARERCPPVVVLEGRDSWGEVSWCDQVGMGLVQRLAELAFGGGYECTGADGWYGLSAAEWCELPCWAV
jgi:hypothetical protein